VITALLLAPLAAAASAVGAALLGGVVNFILLARPEGWRQRKATVDALLRLLDDPAPGVRKNALDAMEVIAPREVLESALARMLNDPDEHNRDAAKRMQEELRKREK
jgi:HEAT repeat protein